jgi:hypothetical protein
MCRNLFTSKLGSNPPFLLAIAVTAWTAACGSSSIDNNQDAAIAEAGQPQDTGVAPLSYCTSKPAVPNVSSVAGTWVIRILGTQIVKAPLVAKPLYPKTLFYMLVNMTQSGTDIVVDGRYCDRAEIDEPGSLATAVIPDKWAHTEKTVRRPGTLVVGADGVSVLTLPLFTELAGAVFDPNTDPLPTTVSDPRVIDEDNDGHPGITVNLTGIVNGSLYSVQRQVTAVTAIAVAPDRFEGVLDFKSEQTVLDSTSTTLTAMYGQSTTSPDPTACDSTFAMVRIADAAGNPSGGSAISTCADVRAQETALFPQ